MSDKQPIETVNEKRDKAAEPYEAPRLIQTGSLRNVLGKSAHGTETVNRFRIAGNKA